MDDNIDDNIAIVEDNVELTEDWVVSALIELSVVNGKLSVVCAFTLNEVVPTDSVWLRVEAGLLLDSAFVAAKAVLVSVPMPLCWVVA